MEPSSPGHLVSQLLCTASVCEVPATRRGDAGLPRGRKGRVLSVTCSPPAVLWGVVTSMALGPPESPC